jgi:hypothetical protein
VSVRKVVSRRWGLHILVEILGLGLSWNNVSILHKMIHLNSISVRNSGISLGNRGCGWNFSSGRLPFLKRGAQGVGGET